MKSLYGYRIRLTLVGFVVVFIFGYAGRINAEFIPPSVGAMGDSNTDEYRTDKNIPGLNWVEQLVVSRDFDFGSFSEISRGEPRRSGYEYNWARDGATATGNRSYDIPSQWPGLVEQVEQGKVDLVFLAIGNNDFYAQGLNIGNSSLSGDELNSYINSIVSRIENALDAVSTAGNIELVLGNIIDVGVNYNAPALELARVTDAVVRTNNKIQFIANERGIPVIDIFGLKNLSLKDSLEIGGVLINPRGRSDDPHDLYLSDGHWGTIAQGLFANMFLEAINRAYGFDIELLSDQEILSNAGITDPNPGEEPTYFDISTLVVDPSGPVTADFNRDGIVDAIDACILVDHWNTVESAYDIGPEPYGDGIIDVQDLIVLSEYLFHDVNDPWLVAHWKLDEIEGNIAKDNSNDNDGTVFGKPTWQPTGGHLAGGIELDGIDDYISSESLINPANGAFSVLTWIKGGTKGQVILSQKNSANWLLADPSEGNLMAELKESGRSGKPLESQTNITDGEWHRIGLVWDGAYRTL
jgi:hypothetical protein